MAWRTWQAGIVSPNAGGPAQINTSPIMANRRIFWVDPNHPNASDANPGTQAEAPLATVVAANGKVVADGDGSDYVIMAAGLEETLSETLSVRATWVGLGAGESLPTFIADGASYIFDITATGTEVIDCIFRGYRDVEAAALAQHVRLAKNTDAHLLQGCEFRFEMAGVLADTPCPVTAVTVGSSGESGGPSSWDEIDSCRFVNLCTLPDTSKGPNYPWNCINVAYDGCAGLRVHGSSFDGGESGFDYGAIYANATTTDVAFYANTFKNGADIQMLATHTGIFSNNTMDAGCNIETLTPITPYPNGLVAAEEGGADILHGPNLFVTGDVFWVDITATRASDSNTGLERDLPFRTLTHALSVAGATACSYVLCAGGSGAVYPLAVETLVTYAVKLHGLSSGTGRPSLAYDNPGAPADVALTFTGNGAELAGFRFTAPTSSGGGTTTFCDFQAIGQRLDGCDFSCGTNSPVAVKVSHTAARMTVENCIFTADDTGAGRGLNFFAEGSGGSVLRSVLSGNFFFGGTYGFATGALAFESAAGLERTLALSNTFLGNAQILVPTAQARTTLAGNISTSSSPVRWGA